jgi:hypothetical protein
VRQRPLSLRSRVVTTKMQLDINVERLLLNSGRSTAPAATLTLQRPPRAEGERNSTSTVRMKPVRWRTDRNWPSRGYPGWSHPQIPGNLVASCGRSRCNESFSQCWPLRSSPAPTQSGSLFPWQRPAAPSAGSAASTGGGSASAQEAQYRCPGSTVVWVNEHSHIYHFPGTRDYGHTKSGAYMCEAEAQTSGNRAAMNERHR